MKIDEKDFGIKLLQRINEMRKKDLIPQTINEIKELYHELVKIQEEQKLLLADEENQEKQIIINGLEFLIGQIRTTLFFMIREQNISCSNGGIRRLVGVLDMKNINITDLITINNHAFVVGEVTKDFSKEKRGYFINDYLKDIADYSFTEYADSKKYCKNDLSCLLNLIIEKINSSLQSLSIINDDMTPQIEVINQQLLYSNRDFHIYISHKLKDIYQAYFGNEILNIEILIQNNNDEYYLLNMFVRKGQIIIEEEKANIWVMSKVNDKVKVLNRTLESYTVKR